MDPLGTNPFGILTFIVAPAILTNASSVMALGTSNRFARTMDRARALSSQVKEKDKSADPEHALRIRQLRTAERRAIFLVRALTAFYLAVGSFAAASLVSLLGALSFLAHQDLLRQLAFGAGFCAGLVGVGGLVCGSGLLVWETRMALHILREETEYMLNRCSQNPNTESPGKP